MRIRQSIAIAAFMTVGTFGTPANAAPVLLLNDTFDDGNSSLTAGGELDTNFFTFPSSGATKAIVNGTTSGLTGNAISFGNASGSIFRPGIAATFGTAADLATVGDKVTLSFDYRFETAPPSGFSVFRFGLYNSNGTPVNGDGFGNAANGFNGRVDDIGYLAGIGVGASGSGAFESEVNAPANSDSSYFVGTTNVGNLSPGTFNAGTTATNASLTITRASATSLTLTTTFGGFAPQSVTISPAAAAFVTSFDTVAIGFGGNSTTNVGYADNINVSFTAVPEPSSLMAFALAGIATLRRRRTRQP